MGAYRNWKGTLGGSPEQTHTEQAELHPGKASSA